MTAMTALLALALAGQSVVNGRETAASAPAGDDCEFHAWPGEGLTSIFYGLFHGGIVNGGQQGRRGYPRIPPGAISTAVQRDLLIEAAPQRALQLPGHRLVVHEEALPSRTIRTSSVRVTPSRSSCYAELMVDDVVLQQDFVNGAKLRVLFRFRDFGPFGEPRRSFTTWADADLDSFPPRTEDAVPDALRELRLAFRQSVHLFGAQLNPPPRRRR